MVGVSPHKAKRHNFNSVKFDRCVNNIALKPNKRYENS